MRIDTPTLATQLASWDGWMPISGTFTYASATTINISAGGASIYNVGDKIRFQNNDSGTYLYVYVVTVADTLLTVQGDAVPNATLTDKYHSKIAQPLNFPDNMIGRVLGYAEATSNEAITTEADITSCSTTVTVPIGGRHVRITAHVRGISTDGPRNMTVSIKESTTQLQTYIDTAAAASAQMTCEFSHVFIPSAGSHTYKLTANANGGTFTLQAAATAPNFILVELL